MKKILAILLALTMVLALAVPSMAADEIVLTISYDSEVDGALPKGYSFNKTISTGTWIYIEVTGTATVAEGASNPYIRFYPTFGDSWSSVGSTFIKTEGFNNDTYGAIGVTNVVEGVGNVDYKAAFLLTSDANKFFLREFKNSVTSCDLTVTITESAPNADKDYAKVDTFAGSASSEGFNTIKALDFTTKEISAGKFVVVHAVGSSTENIRAFLYKDGENTGAVNKTITAGEFDTTVVLESVDVSNSINIRAKDGGSTFNGLNLDYLGYYICETATSAEEALAEYEAAIDAATPEEPGEGTGSEPTASGRFADRAVIFQDETASWLVTNIYDVVYSESMAIKVYSGEALLTTITYDADVDPRLDYSGEPTFAISAGENWADSSDWVAEEWAPQDSMPITKLELWLDGAKVDELTNVILYVPYGKVVDATVWAEDVVGTLTEEEYEDYLDSLNPASGDNTGYISTGDATHMIIINGAVITTAHEFVDGICVYCGHVDTTADDEVIVEIVDPVEPSTEEEEDETVPAEPSEEPEEDTNPETGLALALVPMMIAAAVAVITKK